MVAGGLRLALLLLVTLLAGCVEDGANVDEEEDESTETFDQVDVPCDERDRPVAYPWEQQVDHPEEIRCPGHYSVVDAGDGARADVPQWKAGDWWRYRGSIEDGTASVQCAEYRHAVHAVGEHLNLSVYETRQTPNQCGEDPQRGRDRYYTQESVSWLMTSPEGFIRHETVFPLVDGKRWIYMDQPMGNVVEVEVTHDDEYEFGGETLTVWRVEHTGKDLHSQEQWRQVVWYSDEARNKLREEFHKAGVQQYFWQLVDSVDGYGEDPGILG